MKRQISNVIVPSENMIVHLTREKNVELRKYSNRLPFHEKITDLTHLFHAACVSFIVSKRRRIPRN